MFPPWTLVPSASAPLEVSMTVVGGGGDRRFRFVAELQRHDAAWRVSGLTSTEAWRRK